MTTDSFCVSCIVTEIKALGLLRYNYDISVRISVLLVLILSYCVRPNQSLYAFGTLHQFCNMLSMTIVIIVCRYLNLLYSYHCMTPLIFSVGIILFVWLFSALCCFLVLLNNHLQLLGPFRQGSEKQPQMYYVGVHENPTFSKTWQYIFSLNSITSPTIWRSMKATPFCIQF